MKSWQVSIQQSSSNPGRTYTCENSRQNSATTTSKNSILFNGWECIVRLVILSENIRIFTKKVTIYELLYVYNISCSVPRLASFRCGWPLPFVSQAGPNPYKWRWCPLLSSSKRRRLLLSSWWSLWGPGGLIRLVSCWVCLCIPPAHFRVLCFKLINDFALMAIPFASG